jgi:3'(2'), 5'-bisphosphate nucleotidase
VTDAEIAARIAEEAAALLLDLWRRPGLEGAALGVQADKEANDLILARLARWRPDDPFLSEESRDRPARLSSRRVWIIDPLDGTREYVEGRPDWAVHVALAIDGAPAVGAVALPARGEMFRSAPAPAIPPRAADRAMPRLAVSRNRPPADASRLAEALGAELMPMGSAGAKAMAVMRGDADLYYHDGGQYEWDSCAPAAVALAAGLHASRADGSPLRYNRADTLLPDLLVGRPDLAERAIAARIGSGLGGDR